MVVATHSAALDDARAGEDQSPPSVSASKSSGLPWDGKLEHGVHLRASDHLSPLTHVLKRGNLYGTAELVSLLDRAARSVARVWPGSQLGIGELSARQGGKLQGHHSHRSGRDADIAFFMRDARGRDSTLRRFVAFDIQGRARGHFDSVHFDDARNWALVARLLRDRAARVQYIFVAQSLRTRLLMQGRRQNESDEFLRSAAAVLVQPREAESHDNHFHVRIYCPRDDRPACQDTDPYWPWFDGQTPSGRYDQLPTIRWRMPTAATRVLAQH
jgi:penicillin-insensitive murein endopeptidase